MSKLAPDFSSVTRLGLDLTKHVFQVHAVDVSGAEIDKCALRRGKLLDCFAALLPCTIGMETCKLGGIEPRPISPVSSRRSRADGQPPAGTN